MAKFFGFGNGGGGATLDKTLAQLDALSPAVGDLAYPTDGLHWVYRCLVAGTWSTYYRGDLLVRTALADWPTTVNASSPAAGFAAVDSGGTLLLTGPGLGDGSGRFRSLPAPPYDLRITIEVALSPLSFNAVSLIVRRSSDGRPTQWFPCEFGTGAFGSMRTFDLTSGWGISGSVLTTVVNGYVMTCYHHLRITDAGAAPGDGAARTYETAPDGRNYSIVESRANNAHNMGNTTYDQIGIVVRCANTANRPTVARIVGFENVI